MANNLRIVTDNVTDRATISASTTAGSLTVAGLKTDIKSEVWRATGTSATLTMTWTSGEVVGVICLPFANFTSQATMRARGYVSPTAVVGSATPLFDTGTLACCPNAPMGLWDWGNVPLGVNAFAFGALSYGVVWVPIPGTIQKLSIDIIDSTNSNGYVEVGRVVCGPYWTPVINASFGAMVIPLDRSTHERTDAGDLFTNRGSRSRKLSLSLDSMPAADRLRAWDVINGNGMSRPVLVSLSPENATDPTLEQMMQLYGKLTDLSAISYQTAGLFATKIDLEEV